MATGAGSASPSEAAAAAGGAAEGDGPRGLTLRRKLLAAFSGLALLALIVAGVTLWTTAQWRGTEDRIEAHYRRSLGAQRVRAATFRAFKEVDDALLMGDADAPREFREQVALAATDLDAWAGLAGDPEEQVEVARVREAFDALARDAQQALDLVARGDVAAARVLAEDRLEGDGFRRFEEATDAAVARDRALRKVVRGEVEAARRNTQIVLAIASFGAISLTLLIAAYLASDLFRPLRELRQALLDLGRGESATRLDGERGDEFGAVHRAFNRLAEGLERRRHALAGVAAAETAPAAEGGAGDGRGEAGWRDVPARLTLHGLVARLRARVAGLRADGAGEEERLAALDEADALLEATARLTEIGFPVDLNLSRVDLGAIVYETLGRFHDEIAQRRVGLEVEVPPGIEAVMADRLKLREAVAEIVRNALASLPAEGGGRLGLRVRRDAGRAGGELVLIEVADDGVGMDEALLARVTGGDPFDGRGRPRVGLALTRAIAERHGGRLRISSRPGVGTVVQIAVPSRA